jgi:hypothetical protein
MTTTTRTRVGLPDLLWVAWRGNRKTIIAAGAVALVAVGWILWAAATTGTGFEGRVIPYWYVLGSRPLLSAETLFAAAIAVFWAAPLVAREYEQRTHLVVWGQDITAARWLAGQVVVVGLVVVGLAAALGTATYFLVGRMELRESGYSLFSQERFEAVPHVQIAHAVFGLALGLACSALIRRTLPAMALTLVGFIGVRLVLVTWGRSYYLPPVRSFQAWGPAGVGPVRQVPISARYVDSGYADVNHVPMPAPSACLKVRDYTQCVMDNGVAGHFADFQPVDRVGVFRWIESGIFIALAAALLALAWYWVRRARTR